MNSVETDIQILDEVEKYAVGILSNDLPKTCSYHSMGHTKAVVAAVEEIGKASEVSDKDLQVLIIAAWFHDLGYRETKGKGHEEISAKMAKSFLEERDFGRKKTEQVIKCILATRMPQDPNGLLEEIMCDADMIHIGSSEFNEVSARLREEISKIQDEPIDDETWLTKNIDFLEGHHYFTEYAIDKYNKQKKENLKLVKKKLKKLKKEEKSDSQPITPSKGIETLFRVTAQNHMRLSAIADNKANIMISVNSIILSVLVSVLLRKLSDFPHFTFPALLFVATCLSAVVFSILATRPNITKGKFTREDIHNKSVNLMFFGNFHGMDLGEYEWAMKELMKDYDYLYSTLIRDVYFLGKVLNKKYRLLRISYTIFMIGLVMSIASFIVAQVLLKS